MKLVPRCFPYDYPRLAQIEIWNALRDIEKARVIFIEAPTGIGKTSAVLSYLLEKYDRVLWFCYTHRQQEVVLREAKRIEEKLGACLNTVLIRGISSLCSLKEVRKSIFPHQACRYYSATYGCTRCPYKEQFLKAFSSRLIVATYAYLKEPFFEKISSLIDLADIIVFDEAHHLLLPPRIEIPIQWVEKAYSEVKCLFFEKMINREKIVPVSFTPSISKCEEIFWRNGLSYALEVVLQSAQTSKLFLNTKTNKYLGIDEKFHYKLSGILKTKETVITSATLPSNLPIVLYCFDYSFYRIKAHEYRFKTLVFVGNSLPKKKWYSLKSLSEVNKVLNITSKYYRKVLAVFPSQDTLRNYLEHYALPSNVISIVAGSREAEGIDVDANACIILGVPYDRVTRIVIETVKYFKKYTKTPRILGYTVPAVIKAVQAAGRILRKSNRVIIFFDKRWIQLKKYFPLWLKYGNIKIIKSLHELYNELIFSSIISNS